MLLPIGRIVRYAARRIALDPRARKIAAKVVRLLRPRAFVMENVPNSATDPTAAMEMEPRTPAPKRVRRSATRRAQPPGSARGGRALPSA